MNNRDQIIEHLLDQIDHWDLETLIMHVRDDMCEYYESLSNQELMDDFLEYGNPDFVEEMQDKLLKE